LIAFYRHRYTTINTMKKLAILSAIALSGLIFNTANAQLRVQVGLNVGPGRVVYTQRPVVVEEPVYQESTPVYEDGNDDDYYYLPDVGAYYDVTAECYYYNDGYNWISAAYLPGSYRNYDWRSARRYEIREQRPFFNNDIYRSRYNGREIAEWRNHNNYNRGNDNYYRNRGGYSWKERRNNNHYGDGDNHSAYGQPPNRNHDQNWSNHNGYGQPNQNNGGRDYGQGGYGQPNQNNGGYDRGQGQPSNQNNGGNRDRGGNEHFAGNRPANMGMSHRQARF
jgi:hypothetical protein